ncbi:hypothetical protein [Nocardia wallacei]|nr:hypothetical protein [Nocardia wallacei]
MDSAALQTIAQGLRQSATGLNDSAVNVAVSTASFESSATGSGYRAHGERIAVGVDQLRRHLFSWANCVNDCGNALAASAAAVTGLEQDSAASIGAVPEALV